MESIQDLAKEFGDFSHDAEDSLSALKSFGSDTNALAWVGQTADAFKATFGPLPGRLEKLYVSYGEASDALAAYWPKLQAAQDKADAALRQGQDADIEVTRANDNANNAADDLKSAQAGTDPKAASDAQTAHDNAQKALSDAKGRLAALAAQARQAHDDLEAAGKECAKALHHAQSDGIHNKHWWQHVGEVLSEAGGKIAQWSGEIGQIAAVLAPILNGIAVLTVEVPGLDVVTAGLAGADDLIAATAPEVTTAGLAIKATGDGLQGHWDDLAHDAAYLGASRMGGKGKGGEEGEEGPPPGSMAATHRWESGGQRIKVEGLPDPGAFPAPPSIGTESGIETASADEELANEIKERNETREGAPEAAATVASDLHIPDATAADPVTSTGLIVGLTLGGLRKRRRQ
ncbi:putative T7SS-secreted protein [Catenulispora sp. GP43]|uniref:putative T7SS-secreted protein n=1 Tax=Catenulispora sp. GP43 TaxID=3156263 RepID=UPI003512098B